MVPGIVRVDPLAGVVVGVEDGDRPEDRPPVLLEVDRGRPIPRQDGAVHEAAALDALRDLGELDGDVDGLLDGQVTGEDGGPELADRVAHADDRPIVRERPPRDLGAGELHGELQGDLVEGVQSREAPRGPDPRLIEGHAVAHQQAFRDCLVEGRSLGNRSELAHVLAQASHSAEEEEDRSW